MDNLNMKTESLMKDFEPLFGEWYFETFLGSGSFGKVYSIKREEFGVTYKSALKWISIPADESEIKQLQYSGMDGASINTYYHALVSKLTNEMHIMSRLRGHSNIVSYEDHKIIPKCSGVGYDVLIRMELLTNLNEYYQKKTCTRADLIQLGIDMCNALELCHKYNIIHRDIKPDNIFVADSGSYKLGDFGIARQLEHTFTEMSKKGTLNYMAPEVYKAQQYNSTVDIYSLGIVMYKFANKWRLPFLPTPPNPVTLEDNEKGMIRRMSGEKLPYPLMAEGRLGEIITKACAYDPNDRFSSPKQMREELQAIQFSCEEAKYIYRDGDNLGKKEPSDPIAHNTLKNQDDTQSTLGQDTKPEGRNSGKAGRPEAGEETESVLTSVSDRSRADAGDGGRNSETIHKQKKPENSSNGKRGWIIGSAAVTAVIIAIIIFLTRSSPSPHYYVSTDYGVQQTNSTQSNSTYTDSQAPNTQQSSGSTDTQRSTSKSSPVADDQTYSIIRSSKVLSMKQGDHYPYLCNPAIEDCLGFTMTFSYNVPAGDYVKNTWSVWIRVNGDTWTQVGEISVNEGEQKVQVIRFDRAYTFTEIAVQHPTDYNDFAFTDALSITDIVHG